METHGNSWHAKTNRRAAQKTLGCRMELQKPRCWPETSRIILLEVLYLRNIVKGGQMSATRT
ncbi:hypothetical protein PLANPX_0659 [Lacipirellula parvula]|uniref:Uncharacterized protein n=1 Tax=Lacipirellula parvula TaxID=2650471 RepID=A0A5K7X5F9_9BACT|nr:hypothetical protein PLANPX_0659 [Lacipirellula parvula]